MIADAVNQPGPHVFREIKNLHRYFNRILKAAELEKVDALGEKLTAHSFRHTYGNLLATVLPNAFMLQRALGHKDGRSTDRYIHSEPADHFVDVRNVLKSEADRV